MRRTTLLIASAGFCLTGCAEGADNSVEEDTSDVAATSAPSTPSETSPVDPLIEDQALVRSLYYDLSQAFNQGLEAGAAFDAAHNHPQTPYSAEECLNTYREIGFTETYTVSAVPNVAAMAPDPGWAMPDLRYAGVVPDGRTCIVPVAFDQSDPNAAYRDTSTQQVHVTVFDGAAYFFRPCELPDQ